MALNHLGISLTYDRLAQILRAGKDFTPFGNLQFFEDKLGLVVSHGKLAESEIFEQYIELGLPVIVSVKTFNWKHWGTLITEHAVVVVGIDRSKSRIYINDPYFGEAPIEMSLIAFEMGWIEKGQEYAVLSLVELQ